MSRSEHPIPDLRTATGVEINEAMSVAVSEALRDHQEAGRSIVVWEDGRIIRLSPDEIAICSCSSEAYNLAALALRLQPGDEVIITMNPSRTPGDHKGVLVTLHRKSDGFGWGTQPGEVVD